MAIIKEPKGIDFLVNSDPWTDEELKQFRKLMERKKAELGEKKRLKIEKKVKEASKQPT